MNYWLVRANFGGDDQTLRFFQDNIWENGYGMDKYASIVNRIEIDDYLCLADGSYIIYYAKCKRNLKNGSIIEVDKWREFKRPIPFPAKGNYIRTISSISKQNRKEIRNSIEDMSRENKFEIKSLIMENFMSFKKEKLNFSKGINIFIGENGSGKSQILKLLYSAMDENNIDAFEKNSDHEREREIALSIRDIFKVEKIGNLVSNSFSKEISSIDIDFTVYSLSFSLKKEANKEVIRVEFPKETIEKSSVFIPAKEVLSFYPGFRPLYERKHISFDKTYYNLCKALEAPLNKELYEENEIVSKLILRLEKILEGKISIEDGRFYLKQKSNRYEISIVAEGLRKIGMLTYLLSNDSLNENSILFWDEPESNMHPKLIRDIVEVLVILANSGMQIFIATHSPYLLETFNNHLKRDKIKDLSIEDDEIRSFPALDPNSTTAYYLGKDSVTDILNKKFGLIDDKLLQHFNEITHFYDKMRDIEWSS